jgi:hypothetical protein
MTGEPMTFTVTEAGWYGISYGTARTGGSYCRYAEVTKLDGPDDPVGELVDLRVDGLAGDTPQSPPG